MEQWYNPSDGGNTNINLTDPFGIEVTPPATKRLSLPIRRRIACGRTCQSGDKFQVSKFRCQNEKSANSLLLRSLDEVSALVGHYTE